MTSLPILRVYESFVRKNSGWYIAAIDNVKSFSVCFAPYSMNYYENEEMYVGFESATDVMSMYHNAILGRRGSDDFKCGPESPGIVRLKSLLRLIVKTQLFMEILATKKSKQKWGLIVVIEFIKVVLRLGMLYNNGGRPLVRFTSAELKLLNDRSKCLEIAHKNFPELQKEHTTSDPTDCRLADLVTLYAEHGRGVTPHGSFRPRPETRQLPPTKTLDVISEVLRIIRPLVYSGMRYVSKQEDVKPWAAALATDLMSILLQKLSTEDSPEKTAAESSKVLLLLLYLLRAPVYKRYTKGVLKVFVHLIKRIPLLGSALLGPILDISLELVERRYFTTSAS